MIKIYNTTITVAAMSGPFLPLLSACKTNIPCFRNLTKLLLLKKLSKLFNNFTVYIKTLPRNKASLWKFTDNN